MDLQHYRPQLNRLPFFEFAILSVQHWSARFLLVDMGQCSAVKLVVS